MEKNPKNPQEKENEKPEKKESLHPEFPMEEEKERKDSKDSAGEEQEIDEEYITEVCKDLICIPFEIWHILNPKVTPLSELEKKHISKSLARVAIKYDVDRYMKDEIMLFTFLGFSILTRSRIKKDDKNHSGKEGKGEDISSKKLHTD